MLSLIFPLSQLLSVKAADVLSLYLSPAQRGQSEEQCTSTQFKAGSVQPLSLHTVPKPPAHMEPVPACLELGTGKAGGSAYCSPL